MPDRLATPPADERLELARQQAALVRALGPAAHGGVPDGFDAQALAVTRKSLEQKRSRAVQKSWPALATSMGDQFTAAFTQYAAEQTTCDDPAVDGHYFARWLNERSMLSDDGRVELLRWEIAHGAFLRVVRLRQSRSIVVGLRWRGSRLLRFRLP